MRNSLIASALLLLGCSFALAGCGDDTTSGGDTGGSGDSGGSGGDTGGSSGAGGTSGSGGSSGGTTGDGGGGPIEYGSGTITMDFNGTPVTFEVWQANDFGTSEGFLANADSTNSDTVDSISMSLIVPGTGTFDCTQALISLLSIQADNSEGDTDVFDSRGSSDCTIAVTEYGAPGAPVRGTFSGEVLAAGSESATVANGTFDLVRGSDR